MARFEGDGFDEVISAVSVWRDKAILEESSVFTNDHLWSLPIIKNVKTLFSDNPIAGSEQTFYEKLTLQFRTANPESIKLVSEMLWLLLLFPSNISSTTKVSGVKRVWEISGESFNIQNNMLQALEKGIGSCGIGYNNYRWAELKFLIQITIQFQSFSKEEKLTLLSNSWDFANWLDGIEGAANRQFRHIILFLLFPESFERVSSINHKLMLKKAFQNEIIDTALNKVLNESDSESVVLDKSLLLIRNELKIKDPAFQDFYLPPYKEAWFVKPKTKSVSDHLIPEAQRRQYWIEKSLVKDRPDRLSGPNSLGLALWSPQQSDSGSDIYAAMREVLPGDIILHFTDNSAFTGVSIAESKADDQFIGVEGTAWAGKPSFRIKLKDFQLLNPKIDRKLLLNDEFKIELLQELKNHKKLFYNKDLDLNQGAYLTKAPQFLIDILDKIYIQINGGILPYSTSNTSSESTVESLAYSIYTDASGIFLSEKEIENMINLLNTKKNLILQGPPGTGKSFIAKKLAYSIVGSKNDEYVESIQFHQSYSYEDFMQGFRPQTGGGFSLKNGVFYRFCEKAKKDLSKPHIFIIDEINRGNLSKIFGEVMLLLEADKRGSEWKVTLTYSNEDDPKFFIPENVYVIGMMNTADRSLAMLDYALRRRFAFIELSPAFDSERFAEELESKNISDEVITMIRKNVGLLNQKIEASIDLGRGYKIGHSFFCPKFAINQDPLIWYENIIRSEIGPLLTEYWFDKKPVEIEEEIYRLLSE